jgi:hypothetical protein
MVAENANHAETLDDDKLPGEYPPDEPMGLNAYGTVPAEERGSEPLAERVRREEPDFGEASVTPGADDGGVGTLVEPDAGAGPDEEADAVAGEIDPGPPGARAAGDPAGGDPTTRDVATERAPGGRPAEEAAMHETEPPPMGGGDGYVEGS